MCCTSSSYSTHTLSVTIVILKGFGSTRPSSSIQYSLQVEGQDTSFSISDLNTAAEKRNQRTSKEYAFVRSPRLKESCRNDLDLGDHEKKPDEPTTAGAIVAEKPDDAPKIQMKDFKTMGLAGGGKLGTFTHPVTLSSLTKQKYKTSTKTHIQ
jgi:hypothetical protein